MIKRDNMSKNEKLIEKGVKRYICDACKLNSWLDLPIRLQLNHINGIHDDNRPENLEFLCPNCHSLTDTYGGLNKPYKNKKRKQ